jgi:hypothetical protein
MEDRYKFIIVFQKLEANNRLEKMFYDHCYRGVVNYAAEVFGIDTKDLSTDRWKESEQFFSWEGSKDECADYRQKLEQMGAKQWNNTKKSLLERIAKIPIVTRRQIANMNKRIRELDDELESGESTAYEVFRKTMYHLGVNLYCDIVPIQ